MEFGHALAGAVGDTTVAPQRVFFETHIYVMRPLLETALDADDDHATADHVLCHLKREAYDNRVCTA
jgi:hypothetical protein